MRLDFGLLIGWAMGKILSVLLFEAWLILRSGSFAEGDAQWRIPLAMQIPAAVLLLVLVQFLPQSPRWCKLRLI